MPDASSFFIESLQLQPHPEGGFFRETYRASEVIPENALHGLFNGVRNISTGILFLLRSDGNSMLHRIKSDELWHFHSGSALSIYIFSEEGLRIKILGLDVARGQMPQVVVPANCWFGAAVTEAASYTLCSCTVAPGFDFADFELGNRDRLLEAYPHFTQEILMLTKAK